MSARLRQRKAGFTLVELGVVLAVLGSALMLVTGILVTAGKGYAQVSTDAHGHDSLRDVLERMSADVRRSAQDRIAVDVSGADWDSVTLQVPVRYTGTTTLWGAGGQIGNFVFYYVDDHGDLVRVMLDSALAFTGQREVLAQGLDRARNGEKGFTVVQDGDRYTISLRVLMEGRGEAWTRELETAATVRN